MKLFYRSKMKLFYRVCGELLLTVGCGSLLGLFVYVAITEPLATGAAFAIVGAIVGGIVLLTKGQE